MRLDRQIVGGLLLTLAASPAAHAQEYACSVSDDPAVEPTRPFVTNSCLVEKTCERTEELLLLMRES